MVHHYVFLQRLSVGHLLGIHVPGSCFVRISIGHQSLKSSSRRDHQYIIFARNRYFSAVKRRASFRNVRLQNAFLSWVGCNCRWCFVLLIVTIDSRRREEEFSVHSLVRRNGWFDHRSFVGRRVRCSPSRSGTFQNSFIIGGGCDVSKHWLTTLSTPTKDQNFAPASWSQSKLICRPSPILIDCSIYVS